MDDCSKPWDTPINDNTNGTSTQVLSFDQTNKLFESGTQDRRINLSDLNYDTVQSDTVGQLIVNVMTP
jgi:hypothetical protein